MPVQRRLNPPPRSTPPRWNHWLPGTLPSQCPRSTPSWGLVPNPFPLPIPVSLSPPRLLPPFPLPLPPFPSPDSNLFPTAPTTAVGPVSPVAAPPPRRSPESVVSQWIARPYSVSEGPMSWPSRPLTPWEHPPGGGRTTFCPSPGGAVVLSIAVLPCPGRRPGQTPPFW